jgi:secreted trypsin-like serine protease
MRPLKSLFAAGAVVLALSLTVTAQAVTGGQPDGNAHPWVGLVRDQNGFCSGTLLAPTVFLTAAHCFDPTSAGPPAARVFVSFAPGPIPPGVTDPSFVGGTWYPDPQFCAGCSNGLPGTAAHDVAVVILDRPVTAPQYGRLPAQGLVDGLRNKTDLTIVGYGVRDFVPSPGGRQPDGIRTRYQGLSQLVSTGSSTSDSFIKLSVNNSQGKAGGCFGDSGGPDFLGSTTTILAINSFGNQGCTGVSYSARVDTAAALGYIRGTALARAGVQLP